MEQTVAEALDSNEGALQEASVSDLTAAIRWLSPDYDSQDDLDMVLRHVLAEVALRQADAFEHRQEIGEGAGLSTEDQFSDDRVEELTDDGELSEVEKEQARLKRQLISSK